MNPIGVLNPTRSLPSARSTTMLETIAVVLIILWLLGLVSSHTIGGLIQGLLVIGVVLIVTRMIQGQRV